MRHLDHVLIAARDLDAAIAGMRSDHGLGALAKGSPAPGVVNAAIPLAPPLYLELLTATDPTAHPGGTALAAASDGLFTWAIEADDLDAVAEERGVAVEEFPHWRTVGQLTADLPFFISYSHPRAERAPRWATSYERAAHSCGPGRIALLEVGGDEAEVRRWIGEVDVAIRFTGGAPGLRAVTVETEAGPLVLT